MFSEHGDGDYDGEHIRWLLLFPVMIIGSDGRGCDKIEGDL